MINDIKQDMYEKKRYLDKRLFYSLKKKFLLSYQDTLTGKEKETSIMILEYGLKRMKI